MGGNPIVIIGFSLKFVNITVQGHLINKISILITILVLDYTLGWKLEAKVHISLLVESWVLRVVSKLKNRSII